MRVIIIITLAFSASWVKGQSLSLDDIFNVKKMDSVELGTFSHERGFELKEVEIDIWRSMHKYYSKTDNSVWFERNFPTDRKLFNKDTTTIDARMVNYYFTDKDVLKEFKQKMKEKGFKFKSSSTKDYGGNIFIHNIYQTENNQIDLVLEKPRGQKIKYTLMYYRRIN